MGYGLFRLEIHIVYGFRPHDLQLHMLNLFNFMLYFSVENCYHFLIVKKKQYGAWLSKVRPRETLFPLMHFAKLNKPPSLLSPHPLKSA